MCNLEDMTFVRMERHLPCPLPHLQVADILLEAYLICSGLDLSVDHAVKQTRDDKLWQVINVPRPYPEGHPSQRVLEETLLRSG